MTTDAPHIIDDSQSTSSKSNLPDVKPREAHSTELNKLDKLKQSLLPSFWSHSRYRWILYSLMPILFVVLPLILIWQRHSILPAFHFLHDYLPLVLPILSVLISIMLRPDELATRRGVLQLCNPLALGFVSFAIWAFVAGQGVTQYIRINDNAYLNRDHSLLLVFCSFLWLGFCSVVSALATIGRHKMERKWQLIQVALVGASIALLFMPFFLFETKDAVQATIQHPLDHRVYRVSLPFRDPSLDIHLGTSGTPLLQCKVLKSIEARSSSDARDKALKVFEGLAESFQRYPNRSLARDVEGQQPLPKVEIQDALIVVSEESPEFGAGR